jgi:hypothetical protein
MQESLEKRIFDRFRFFHPENDVTKSLMRYGFQCHDGWFDLLWNLFEEVEKIVDSKDDFEILQVKSKNGVLRIWTKDCPSISGLINNVVKNAVEKSGRTCEICGEVGSKRIIKGWIWTLCDPHEKDARDGKYSLSRRG